MEAIVVGVARINFHQNLSGVMNEKSASNLSKGSTIISVSQNTFSNLEKSANISDDYIGNSINNLSFGETVGESGWEEIEDNLEKNKRNRIGHTLTERRRMPSRASKESLLRVKRRTILKPTKRIKNREDFQNLKFPDIKKIYLNKKLTKFKPSCLETIFEEPSTFHSSEPDCPLMGGRKIKRLLSFTDGFRYTKTLVNKRRAKIKKTFGKKFALKKISLEEFIKKLNSSIENNKDFSYNDSQMQDGNSEFHLSNTFAKLDDESIVANNFPSTGLSCTYTNNMSLVDKY